MNAFGGGCTRCKYSRCMGALDFHHTDPKKKDITWAFIRKLTVAKAVQKLRAEKVVLVCSNCHRELHWMLEKKALEL